MAGWGDGKTSSWSLPPLLERVKLALLDPQAKDSQAWLSLGDIRLLAWKTQTKNGSINSDAKDLGPQSSFPLDPHHQQSMMKIIIIAANIYCIIPQ